MPRRHPVPNSTSSLRTADSADGSYVSPNGDGDQRCSSTDEWDIQLRGEQQCAADFLMFALEQMERELTVVSGTPVLAHIFTFEQPLD